MSLSQRHDFSPKTFNSEDDNDLNNIDSGSKTSSSNNCVINKIECHKHNNDKSESDHNSTNEDLTNEDDNVCDLDHPPGTINRFTSITNETFNYIVPNYYYFEFYKNIRTYVTVKNHHIQSMNDQNTCSKDNKLHIHNHHLVLNGMIHIGMLNFYSMC